MARVSTRIGIVAALMGLGGCASSPQTAPVNTMADATPAATSANESQGEPLVAGREEIKTFDKSDPSKDKLHCTKIQPTGSHRVITRCVSLEQRELEQDAARNTLMKSTGPAIQMSTN